MSERERPERDREDDGRPNADGERSDPGGERSNPREGRSDPGESRSHASEERLEAGRERPGPREERGLPGEGVDEQEEEEEEEAEEGADEDDDTGAESVTIEITGLSLYTHHGASAAEREVGQRLVLDLRLDLAQADATATDRLEDTVDYADVCQLVALIAQQRSHRTLERLCATIAERLLDDYPAEVVFVKATKPEPPIPLPVEAVSVEVWREAE
jgi:7,8-dihydroneopterin aldolase/epimerase/oxygenase